MLGHTSIDGFTEPRPYRAATVPSRDRKEAGVGNPVVTS